MTQPTQVHREEVQSTPRCQSCGMPLGPGFHGTNADKSESSDFCRMCFQRGEFTEPDLTLDGMLEKSVAHMMSELKFPREKARTLAESVIPRLRRWNRF